MAEFNGQPLGRYSLFPTKFKVEAVIRFYRHRFTTYFVPFFRIFHHLPSPFFRLIPFAFSYGVLPSFARYENTVC